MQENNNEAIKSHLDYFASSVKKLNTSKNECPLLNKNTHIRKRKVICETWDYINKSESEEDFDKERKF